MREPFSIEANGIGLSIAASLCLKQEIRSRSLSI
jgi:hypothetical protein